MLSRTLWLAVAFVLGTSLTVGCHRSVNGSAAGAASEPAPGFAGATAWLNVDKPLAREDLRGKVVVVDFWTSCCINCIHTLPILAELEKKEKGRPFIVVGVHSAKFDAEKDQERLRAIMAEYSITHPVAIDGTMAVWNAWKVKAWPTLFVLDGTGAVVWQKAGESTVADIEGAVTRALDDGGKRGILSDKPVPGLHPEPPSKDPLAFPGKVTALRDGSLAVSDTAHHRVVLVGKDGALQAVVGSGLRGFSGGGFESATFNEPEGIAEAGDTLYVADTQNHAIRAIDRATRTVTTVAGTGELGQGELGAPLPARSVKLRSPWDVVTVGGIVYVALAGSHQIAALDPLSGTIGAFAGDGQERRLDGDGLKASFAQPSGLATDGTSLFVADAESSSIRRVVIATRTVTTLVGQDLFVFGDQDGPPSKVRLEHPLGVAFGGGALFIADTYNSKVKRLDLDGKVTRTLLGGRDHEALFEPEGLSFHDGDLLVADTKHDRIVRISSATGIETPIEIRGLTPPASGVATGAQDKGAPPSEVIALGEVAVSGTKPTSLHFDWHTPQGTGVNEEAPFHLEWTTSEGLALVPEPLKTSGAAVQHGFDLTVTPISGVTGGSLGGEMSLVLCDVATHLVCVPVRRRVELTFRIASSAAETKSIEIPLPEAKP